jgi:hypothetical protein
VKADDGIRATEKEISLSVNLLADLGKQIKQDGQGETFV